MTTITMRPTGTFYQGSWSVGGGAPTPHAALADGSDSTYIQAGTLDWGFSVGFLPPTIPAYAQIRSVAVRVRRQGNSSGTLNVSLGRFVPGAPLVVTTFANAEQPPAGIVTRLYGSLVRAPGGAAWTPQVLGQIAVGLGSLSTAIRVYEIYVDVEVDEAPTCVITSPVGTVRGSQLPVIVAAYSDPELAPCERVQGKVFTSAVAAAAGFSPFTSTALFDSGEILSTTPQVAVGVPLPAGGYVAAFRAADAGSGGRFGPWATAAFTMSGELPATPTVTVTADDARRRVVVAGVQRDNLLGYDQSLFASGWVPADGNTSVTSTSTTGPPTSGGGAGLVDTFTGANGALTGANSDLDWTVDSGSWTVSSNQVTCSTGGGSATTPPSTLRSATQVLASSDHYVEIDVTALPSSAAAAVWLRMSAAHVGYLLQVTGWGQWIVERWAGAGVKFPISSGFHSLPKPLSLTATVRGEIQGSTIRILLKAANDSDFQLLGEFTDTNIVSGVQPGLSIYNGLSNAKIDGFRAGEFAPVVGGGSDSGTELGEVTLTAARPGTITSGGPDGSGAPVIAGETVTVRASVWQKANAARQAALDAEFDSPTGPLTDLVLSEGWPGASGGWNTGRWTSSHQTGASDAVAFGGGILTTGTAAGSSPARMLGTGMASRLDAEVVCQFALSSTTATEACVALRASSSWFFSSFAPSVGYYLLLDGSTNTMLVRAAAATTLNGAGSSFTPKAAGTWVRFRVRDLPTRGTTLVQAKWWDVGADEPAAWSWSGEDTTYYGQPGQVAVSAVSVDATSRSVTFRTLTVDSLDVHDFGVPFATRTDGMLASTSRNVTVPDGATAIRLYATAFPTGTAEHFVWAAAGVLPGAGRDWSRGGLGVANLYDADEAGFADPAAGTAGWTCSDNASLSRVAQPGVMTGAALQLSWSSGGQDVLYATGPGKPAVPGMPYSIRARVGRYTGAPLAQLGLEFRDASDGVLYRSFAAPVSAAAGATALSRSTHGAIAPDATATVHACLAASAASPAAQVSQVALVPGAVVPAVWQPGPAAAGYLRAESSDDGGRTWQLIRGTTSAFFGPTRSVTVYDCEAPTGGMRLWRVSTGAVDYGIDATGAGLVVSAPAGPFQVVLATPGWWLRDTLTPSRLLAVHIPGDLEYASDEPQTVYWPLGRTTPVIVTDTVKSETFTVPLLFQTELDWQRFEELRRAGVPLLLAGPAGRQWFVRLGQTRKTTLMRSSDQANAPVRPSSVTATEVDRPDPSLDLSDLMTGLLWEVL